ncbi:MAG TPA: hypothetical protein VFI25_19480 [Planctomycetota bacterium]|jgi:hypothetical protein|nr:hypothetical protein [Planctomycetota bacterium]
MASKKILLEVLQDRNRVPPATHRPKREERRRDKSARGVRPVHLPSTQTLGIVLAGVVAIVTAYGIGFWRGHNRAGAPAQLSTTAADLLDLTKDARPPAQPVAGNAGAPKTEEVRWGVQLVSYEPSEKNKKLATDTRTELQKLGLPDPQAWEESASRGGMYFVTVGSFGTKEDQALAALVERVKGMPFGKEKAPFARARIRELQ